MCECSPVLAPSHSRGRAWPGCWFADAIAAIREARGVEPIQHSSDLTDLVQNRAESDGWKTDEDHCVLCSVALGKKLESADTRWHCKHCGRSCCIKCAPNSSKRPMPKYGFMQPVRSCLECTELLDAQNVAVDAMEAALEAEDMDGVLSLFMSRLLSVDYEGRNGVTPLILAVLLRQTSVIKELLDMGASLNLARCVACYTLRPSVCLPPA